MLSCLTRSFRRCGCGCGRSGCSSSVLGPLNSEALVRWSSEIQQDLIWWWAHERLELVSSLGRGFSPVDLWSDSSYVGWALVSTLFEVPSGP